MIWRLIQRFRGGSAPDARVALLELMEEMGIDEPTVIQLAIAAQNVGTAGIRTEEATANLIAAIRSSPEICDTGNG